MRKIALLCLIAVLAIMPLGSHHVSAQDDGSSRFTEEQQELIDTLTLAFENIVLLEALQYNQTQTLSQNITTPDVPGVGEIVNELVQDIESVVIFEEGDDFGNPSRVSQILDQTLTVSGTGTADESILQTLEVIFIEGVYFVRITQLSPADSALPEGWLNWTENPTAIPGVEVFNIDQLFTLGAIVPSQEVAEVAYDDIYLVEAYEEDGEVFQVIEVVWNVGELYTNALFGLDEAFNLEALGIPTDEFLTVFIDGSSLTYRVTVNTTTNLPVSISTELTSELDLPAELFGVRLLLNQLVSNELNFSTLDEVPEIVAPEIEE